MEQFISSENIHIIEHSSYKSKTSTERGFLKNFVGAPHRLQVGEAVYSISGSLF